MFSLLFIFAAVVISYLVFKDLIRLIVFLCKYIPAPREEKFKLERASRIIYLRKQRISKENQLF
jgi:hypothetical protein